MSGEGYWLNARTGRYLLIHEHARCISKKEKADAVGLSEALYERLDGLHWRRDRLQILLTAMEDGLVRVRDHDDVTTFECTLPLHEVVPTADRFLDETGLAGATSRLLLNDLRRRRSLSVRRRELSELAEAEQGAIEEQSVAARLRRYSPHEIDRILDGLSDVGPPGGT